MTRLFVVTHAAFDKSRVEALVAVVDALRGAGVPFHVQSDFERKGSLWCWREGMRTALERGHNHVVWLPDDALLCPRFFELHASAVSARPDVVFDCYANHDKAPTISSPWYTTPEGYVGVGGTMPRALLSEHLAWRAEHLDDRTANDEGVNLWAMATGRLIWKTTRSLVGHRDDLPSLDGNGHHSWRTPATMSDGSDEQWSEDPVYVGRTYVRNHWGLISRVKPPLPRLAYAVERS